MSWTDERVETLKKLWMDGLSASQIAAELGEGVTRNAVIGKVHRLKLSARAKPATTSPRPRPANRPAARRPATTGVSTGGAPATLKRRQTIGPAQVVGATALKASEETEMEVEIATAVAAEIEIPEAERLGLMDLNEHTCKWPIGDPLNADFHFCGRESEEGKPYCDFHSRRAYHQIDRKRR